MRLLIAAFIVGACAGPWGWSDCEAADHVGIYFDTSAETYCIGGPQPLAYTAYVVIIEPSSPEILGVEFRLDDSGAGLGSFFSGAQWLADTNTAPDLDTLFTTGYHEIFNVPLVPTSPIVPVMSCDWVIAWDSTRDYYVKPAINPSIDNGLPAYIGQGGVIIPLHTTSGDPSLPVASVGRNCRTVDEEQCTFGALKSLYR